MKRILVAYAAKSVGNSFILYFLEKYHKSNKRYKFAKGNNEELRESAFSHLNIQGAVPFVVENHMDNLIKNLLREYSNTVCYI